MDVFVKDLITGEIVRANTTSEGTEARGYSIQPSLSADGLQLAFTRSSGAFDGRDWDYAGVSVKHLKTGAVVNAADGEFVSFPSLSSDGRYLAACRT